MKAIIGIIVGIIFIGIIALLCLFMCILASRSDEYWEDLRKEFGENGRH